MEPFIKINGIVALLNRSNVDTDQIIPKQFLKRIERTGFGEFLFFDWRYNIDGSLNNDFELNFPQFRGATILLTRDNFGSGSSREHAPWALKEYGFRVIIAPSFADIFYNNCFKNSILPIVQPNEEVDKLFKIVSDNTGYQLNVDLEKQTIVGKHGVELKFDIDPFKKKALLEGLDDISETLMVEEAISNYENHLNNERTWLLPTSNK